MDQTLRSSHSNRVAASVCPHDCPSTCALEVEVLDERTIGRVRGAEDNDYTAGVICAKVARYAERVHHPDRLTRPLVRKGAKGSGEFTPVSWDQALDLVAEKFLQVEQRSGAQAIWPYYYAGTMGLVMRDGINRLRHAKRYCRVLRDDLRQFRLGRLRRRDRKDRRSRSARDGEIRPDRHLGNQRRQHAGQRDDARGARPQGARRQDRCRGRVHERHHGARPTCRCWFGPAPTARLPARSCIACFATERPTGPISTATRMSRASSRSTCADEGRNGRPASPAARSRRSRPSPAWSGRPSGPISASATASRARATAPPTCTPRAAFRQ